MAASSVAEAPRLYFGYWLIVGAFATQFISHGVTNYVAGAFLAPMTADLGWTRAEFTIPRSLGGFVMALTGFFIGAWVDRFGGRPFMIAGVVLSAVSLWALSTVQTLAGWIVLNGVALTASAAMFGNLVANVTLAKWFVELRGRAVALAAMGVSFGGIALTPAATWAIDAWGWRAAWQGLGVTALVCALPFALLMRRAPEDFGLRPDGHTDVDAAAGRTRRAEADYARSMTRRQALGNASFYLLILAFGLFVINIGVMLLQTVPYLTDAGHSRATAAFMMVVASIPAMLTKPVWGHLIDRLGTPMRGKEDARGHGTATRLGAKPLAAIGSALTGIATAAIVLSVASGSLVGIYAAFFLLGVGWGGMIPLQEVIWASFFGRRHLGAVRSAALPFSLAFGAGAPLAVSYYHDVVGDYHGALLSVAVANLIAALLILAIRAPRG